MVDTGDGNGDGGGKSASRARNMSLSPRSGPKATPTQKELAEASALEKRFAKDFKLDDAGEEVARVKTLFQSTCTRLKLLLKCFNHSEKGERRGHIACMAVSPWSVLYRNLFSFLLLFILWCLKGTRPKT
jgi:hypothetical protein